MAGGTLVATKQHATAKGLAQMAEKEMWVYLLAYKRIYYPGNSVLSIAFRFG
jgi:hypothetical protein